MVRASISLTREHPFSPEGMLFTYFPSEDPETLHYHDFLEIGYCETGTGLFYIDGGVIPFSGRCCSIIYGGQVHIAQSINAEKSLWHFLYIDLPKLFEDDKLLLLEASHALHPQIYDFPSLIPYETDGELYRLCELIMAEAAQCKEGFLQAIRALTMAMLIRHSRHMTPAARPRSDDVSLLKRLGEVLRFINLQYMNELSVNDLTAVAHTSKSALQRDMLAFTGMAPMQYVHHIRLNHAAAMLLDGNMAVSDIAYGVGYNTLSSFNRQFLAKFKMSPSQWRAGHMKGSR